MAAALAVVVGEEVDVKPEESSGNRSENQHNRIERACMSHAGTLDVANVFPPLIHAKRLQTVLDTVGTLTSERRLGLTALSRALARLDNPPSAPSRGSQGVKLMRRIAQKILGIRQR